MDGDVPTQPDASASVVFWALGEGEAAEVIALELGALAWPQLALTKTVRATNQTAPRFMAIDLVEL